MEERHPLRTIGEFLFYLPNKHAGNLLDAHGQYHEIFEERIYDGLAYCSVEKEDVVLDVGANIGLFAFYCLKVKKAKKVICLEPEPDCCQALKKNARLHDLEKNIYIIQKGAWSSSGRLKFHVFHEHKWGSKIVSSSSGFHEGDLLIEVTAIDTVVDNLKLPVVNFAKMDIEGAEYEALKGLQKTITRFRPKMAVCTYHHDNDKERIVKAVERMDKTYKLQHYTGNNPMVTVARFY